LRARVLGHFQAQLEQKMLLEENAQSLQEKLEERNLTIAEQKQQILLLEREKGEVMARLHQLETKPRGVLRWFRRK